MCLVKGSGTLVLMSVGLLTILYRIDGHAFDEFQQKQFEYPNRKLIEWPASRILHRNDKSSEEFLQKQLQYPDRKLIEWPEKLTSTNDVHSSEEFHQKFLEYPERKMIEWPGFNMPTRDRHSSEEFHQRQRLEYLQRKMLEWPASKMSNNIGQSSEEFYRKQLEFPQRKLIEWPSTNTQDKTVSDHHTAGVETMTNYDPYIDPYKTHNSANQNRFGSYQTYNSDMDSANQQLSRHDQPQMPLRKMLEYYQQNDPRYQPYIAPTPKSNGNTPDDKQAQKMISWYPEGQMQDLIPKVPGLNPRDELSNKLFGTPTNDDLLKLMKSPMNIPGFPMSTDQLPKHSFSNNFPSESDVINNVYDTQESRPKKINNRRRDYPENDVSHALKLEDTGPSTTTTTVPTTNLEDPQSKTAPLSTVEPTPDVTTSKPTPDVTTSKPTSSDAPILDQQTNVEKTQTIDTVTTQPQGDVAQDENKKTGSSATTNNLENKEAIHETQPTTPENETNKSNKPISRNKQDECNEFCRNLEYSGSFFHESRKKCRCYLVDQTTYHEFNLDEN